MMLQNRDSIFQCTLCAEPFTDLIPPKILRCGHSVCELCAIHNTTIDCPKCSCSTVDIQTTGLPNNRLIGDILEISQQLSACEVCQQIERNGAFCSECACQNAYDDQRRFYSLFECPICFDAFLDPKVLYCGHTICLCCAIRLRSPGSTVITCPECRAETKGISDCHQLPTNYLVIEAMQHLYRNCESDAVSECSSDSWELLPKKPKKKRFHLHPKLKKLHKKIKGRHRSKTVCDSDLADSASSWLQQPQIQTRPVSLSFNENANNPPLYASQPLYEYPSDLPLPQGAAKSNVLTDAQIRQLLSHLPARMQVDNWVRVYATEEHGYSLSTLYSKTKLWPEDTSPMLVVIRDTKGRVFGASTSSFVKSNQKFRGIPYGSMLFRFYSDHVQSYGWAGTNDIFVDANSKSLAFGASKNGQNGLWIDEDLNKGRTDPCETFDNPRLVPEGEFVVSEIEVWGFNVNNEDWKEISMKTANLTAYHWVQPLVFLL